ncbi:helix-turn-helix domain-containing protein [Marininema halotolerans]|uniref:Helix-turn-helix n=1 Tax=Marininema halotolerans TaxID=1155944 RepID=A0A1I6PNE2_9BACL|nr:helix-turn-helix transcriptional regulator [Marininema halotolerans]SFS41747.1 Helix-turn-helix [Marininema halotolerans]
MEPSKIKDVGEVIRRVRKSKGLRLEDLADDKISPATISNIERGIAHVHQSKVYYIVNKLGISMEHVPSILLEQKEELDEVRFNLFSIDTLINLEDARGALKELEEMDLDDHHPYAAMYQHLKGKAYLYLKNWKRAERCLGAAINLSSQNNDIENTEALSFLNLSSCCYYQNEIEKALEFVYSGLDAFKREHGNKYIRLYLIRNEVTFLDRLGRSVEGLRVIQDVWDQLKGFEDTDTVLFFYLARAELLSKTGMIDEAAEYATQGLKIAKISKTHMFIFNLYLTLGSLYTSNGQWKKAERCIHTTLASKHLMSSENPLTDAYIRLGKLNLLQEKRVEAKEAYEMAIANAEKLNDAPRLITALKAMGDYFKTCGEKLEASPYYERALKLAQQYNYRKDESELHFCLALCYQDNNQQEFQNSLLNIYESKKRLESREEGAF